MQVSVESVNTIERRITVGVPAERIETEVQKRLQQASQTARIDGFRPGKVPFRVIKQRYGESVRQEVAEEVMRESYGAALTQENLKPVGPPTIEAKELVEGKDLEFVATIEIFPEIKLADLSELEFETIKASVEDSDVDVMIETLREQHPTMVEVKRNAKLKDQVVLDYIGSLDGSEFLGGTAQDQTLVLGSNTMIPGFEDGLVGLKKGDEKVLSLQFPAEYHAEELAGKDVEFKVTVKSVSEPVLPELNDEFYAKFGVTEGGNDKFREEIARNMSRELKAAIKNKTKTRLLDVLIKAHDFDLPSTLVEGEVGRLRDQMLQQLGGGQGIDPSNLPIELFKPEAEKRVSSGLVINQYIQANKIKPDEARLRALIEEMASTYEDPKHVIDYIYGDDKQLAQFRSMSMEDQVMEVIISQMKVNEIAMPYADAIKPDEPKTDKASEEKTADKK
jgi:trigger factor